MGVSTLVVAALPIPATALHSIPTYSFQTGTLSVYSSLFCFLTLAFIFFGRHSLARMWFRDGLRAMGMGVGVVAFILILGSAGCVFAYQTTLLSSVRVTAETSVRLPQGCSVNDSMYDCMLAHADAIDVGDAPTLMALYLGVFVLAEAAFVLMATREYMQEVLNLSDETIIALKQVAPNPS
jgi:hypothetical protein